MRIMGAKPTRSGAEQWGTEQIHTYMKNHGGDAPEYNKNTSGKQCVVNPHIIVLEHNNDSYQAADVLDSTAVAFLK